MGSLFPNSRAVSLCLLFFGAWLSVAEAANNSTPPDDSCAKSVVMEHRSNDHRIPRHTYYVADRLIPYLEFKRGSLQFDFASLDIAETSVPISAENYILARRLGWYVTFPLPPAAGEAFEPWRWRHSPRRGVIKLDYVKRSLTGRLKVQYQTIDGSGIYQDALSAAKSGMFEIRLNHKPEEVINAWRQQYQNADLNLYARMGPPPSPRHCETLLELVRTERAFTIGIYATQLHPSGKAGMFIAGGLVTAIDGMYMPSFVVGTNPTTGSLLTFAMIDFLDSKNVSWFETGLTANLKNLGRVFYDRGEYDELLSATIKNPVLLGKVEDTQWIIREEKWKPESLNRELDEASP